ncbi:hypothetical protein Efla_006509 [Eimeria flavescens]
MSSASSSRSRWRIPECLEQPCYKHYSVDGATYRLLDIPPSCEALNRAEWNQEAFAVLASGRLQGHLDRPVGERKQNAREGGDSELSERLSSSAASEPESDAFSISSEQMQAELAVGPVTEEEMEEEEAALDANFLAACAATKEGDEWRASVSLPRRVSRTLLRPEGKEGPLSKLLDALGVRTEAKSTRVSANEGVVTVPLWGPTEKRVCLAVKKTRGLLAQLRASCPVTHFISLPLNTSDTIARFEVYRHLVLASKYRTVDETLFIQKEKLHVTLLVLRLLSEAEVAAAAAVLKAASPDIYDAVGTQTLRLHVKGNSCFSDDPSAVKVVFAPLYSSEGPEALAATKAKLNSIVGLLADRLEAAGLLTRRELEEQHALGPQGEIDCIYHMTLLNATYRFRAARQAEKEDETGDLPGVGREGEKGGRPRRRLPRGPSGHIDASQLLVDMKGFDFGQVRIPAVQLNALQGGSQTGYLCLAHVDLP